MSLRHRLLFTLCAAGLMAAGTASASPDTLTFIHVNDSHAHLRSYNGGATGGIARAATVIAKWKRSAPNPILVHAGDFLVGTLESNAYWGVPELQMLNGLGCDVLCLGNHEFDAGPAQLAGIFDQASLDSTFHVICSNARFLDSVPALRAHVHSHAIVHRGRTSVGFVGLTTPSADVESNPQPVFLDTALVQSAMAEVLALRAAGCAVVVVVSHLGLATDMLIAQYLTGVDAIIGGHSHTRLDSAVVVNGIPIVQAEAFYHFVGKLQLVVDNAGVHLLSSTLKELDESVSADHATDSVVAVLAQGVAAQYAPVLGDPGATISHACDRIRYYPRSFDTLDTPLGNLLTTAMLADPIAAGANCALEPTGHMAEDLFAGPVTAADIFRTYPYGFDTSDGLGFRIAVYRLTGTQLLTALQALLMFIDPTTNYYEYLAQSSGLDFTVAVGASGLTLADARVAGRPVNPDSTYTIVSSDRVVGYLTQLFDIHPDIVSVGPASIVQVVRNYVAAHDPICPQSTGHNRVASMVGVRSAEVAMAGPMLATNYPNPVRSSTVIPYVTTSDGDVRVEIVDQLGNTVRILVLGRQAAGVHVAGWSGTDATGKAVPSGVYVCRMAAHGQTLHRMILVTH